MRWTLSVLTFTFSLSAYATLSGKVYLDLEDGDTVTLFNDSGYDFKSCAQSKSCKPLAWPDRTANINITGKPIKKFVQDPYTKKWLHEEYYPVHVNYPRIFNCLDSAWVDASGNRSGTPNLAKCQRVFGNAENNYMDIVSEDGWMDGTSLSEKKHEPYFKPKTKAPCPSTGVMPKNKELANTQEVIEKSQQANWEDAAEKLSKIAGKCVWTDDKKTPKQPPNPFDTLVLPSLQKDQIPKGLVNENNKPITKEQVAEIAALARTLYGEMANCFKSGIHHAAAVAKIALNRSETPNRNEEWIRGDHQETKSDFTKLLTSPSQFNCWKPTLDSKVNGGFQLAMCPPSSSDAKFWNGAKPPANELEHWNHAMKIASLAVLNPSAFKTNTKDIKGYFYTSGDETIPGISKEIHPTIAGRKLKYNCVRVWSEK